MLQYLLQPSITDTKAVGPCAPGSGRLSNFSTSGNEISTAVRPVLRTLSSMAGRRWSVWGPNTRSTIGARSMMAWPSWLATHPPTPMTTCGLSRFSCFQRPSWENTFSCAFSRIEQVLTRMTSASSSRSVNSRPWEAASTSAIFIESYSFIWHPWVLMYSLPFIGVELHQKGPRRIHSWPLRRHEIREWMPCPKPVTSN